MKLCFLFITSNAELSKNELLYTNISFEVNIFITPPNPKLVNEAEFKVNFDMNILIADDKITPITPAP
jgi:hypothetical protein